MQHALLVDRKHQNDADSATWTFAVLACLVSTAMPFAAFKQHWRLHN
jgi:hypothetical protein